MSAPMLELEERPAIRVEPAKQWRNWYRVIRAWPSPAGSAFGILA